MAINRYAPLLLFAVACTAPRPQVALSGDFHGGPVVRDGQTYTLATFTFQPAGYWNEMDTRSSNASFYSNGTYAYDGTALTLRSTLSWMRERKGIVRNDTIFLDSLALVR